MINLGEHDLLYNRWKGILRAQKIFDIVNNLEISKYFKF